MSEARKRAFVFNRESKGKGSSIGDQDRENREACEELGADIVAVGKDEVSASRFGRKERKGWPQVVEWVRDGRLDVLVLWEISRGDRTMDTWVPFISMCRERGVLIHVTSEESTYDPRKAGHRKALLDKGSDAEHETDKLSARARKGIAGAALAGKPHGPSAYGLTRIYGPIEDGKRTFTERPDEHAPVAKEIIERVAREDPVKAIADDLNARGVLSPFGVQWSRKIVRRVATNPAYIGMRSHNGQLHDASWPAIVDEEIWRQAQSVLGAPDRVRSAPGSMRYLLSYVAVSSCGSALQAWPPREGRRPSYRCHGDGCTGVDMWALDTYVTRLACKRLAEPDARSTFAPDDEAAVRARAAVRAIRDELDDLAAQVARGPANGGISATLAAGAEPGIRARLADAERELDRHVRHGALMALLDADDVDEAWGGLSVAGQRSIVGVMFKRIEVGPAERRLSRWSTDDDRLASAADRTTVTWSR